MDNEVISTTINYQNGKTGECGNGSTKKQYEKLQSIFRNRWHSLDTSEVTGLLSLSLTHTHTHTHTQNAAYH